MSRYIRIKGGEKNTQTGKKWSKEELRQVLNLYLSDRNLKIHENNVLLHELAKKVNRTVRSIEAQLLMFRNLDKFGFYGFRNMSSISKQLWKEYIDNTTT